MLFWDDWDELLKAHKYSRKEFVNGVMRYYYDKDDNFSRMTRCTAEPLAVSEAMTAKQIAEAGENYIKNVWIADWKKKENKDKAICRELRGKKVCFGGISFKHLKKKGKRSPQGAGARSKQNLLNHVKYLPLAKELLEENGVHTQSRYEEIKEERKDGAVAIVYQTVSGLAPAGDANKYIHVTVSQLKYKDGHLGRMVYISAFGTSDEIEKSALQPAAFSIRIGDITEGNRQAKYDELIKCLNGEEPRYIADDGTRRLGSAEITLKDLSAERVNKALRTVAFSLGVQPKAGKGEAFAFKAHEDLADKWAGIFASLVRETYDFITDYLSLPQVTVMSKAYLMHKGKILYSPETGEPIKQADWDRFVKKLEAFLNRKTKLLGKRIVLEGKALGAILDRMLKYNTLDAIRKARLEGLKYRGKDFDWIAADIKNLKSALGEPLTRMEAARIQVMQMSAAQRITKMTAEMKESAKQILIDGVRNRQGASQVSQALFDRFVGLNSNYQRIAETEIQNAVSGAIVHEEVHNAKEGEKVYFQRVEIIDDNTCPYCKRMEGKIAVWSDVPLADEKVKDQYADFAIWEGKEWTGGKHIAAVGCFHPYCRGFWTRWTPEGRAADAYVAEIFKRGKKWKEAVETARKEYKAKGIDNPDDRTAGFRDRIEELFAGAVKKSAGSTFDPADHPRGKNGEFISKNAAAQGSAAEAENGKAQGKGKAAQSEQKAKGAQEGQKPQDSKAEAREPEKEESPQETQAPKAKSKNPTAPQESQQEEKAGEEEKQIQEQKEESPQEEQQKQEEKKNEEKEEKKKLTTQDQRLNFANTCPTVITDIEPLVLTEDYREQVKAEYAKLRPLASSGKLICTALNKPVTWLNEWHEIAKNNRIRTKSDMENHAAYIPFIPSVLEHGIYDSKMDRKMKGGAISHEIVCRAKITENNETKMIGISVILAENEEDGSLDKISVFRMEDKKGIIRMDDEKG